MNAGRCFVKSGSEKQNKSESSHPAVLLLLEATAAAASSAAAEVEPRALLPPVDPAAHVVPPPAGARRSGELEGAGAGAREQGHDAEVGGALEGLAEVVDAVVFATVSKENSV